MTCAICGIRKPRRFCPGVNGDICTICCGTGREETVDCPLECEYLQDAHRHERLHEIDPDSIPNADVDVPDSFLEEHEWLIVLLGSAVIEAARTSPGITDFDLREAFENLVRMYRAMQSGLYYESLPVNPYAATVVRGVQARVEDIQNREKEARGSSTLRDQVVLGVIVFLQRLEFLHNNRRRRSRAFLDFLTQFFVEFPKTADLEPEPDEPRIIL